MKLKLSYIYLFLLVVSFIFLINIPSQQHLYSQNVNDASSQNSIVSSNINSPEMEMQLRNLFQIVMDNPSDTSKIVEYADLLVKSNSPESAIELYEEVLEIDNNRMDILLKMNSIYLSNHDYHNSKEIIDRILELDPKNQIGQYNLGLVEVKIGDINLAKKQWKDLIANHPNTKMSTKAKESLERLAYKSGGL